ncbi:MAG: NADP-dependent isocitrate dehydrogenase [Helicobacter sp.]|nr:NADP-dependent isocitrate dehydrogenase [Helicobacter sp.]
MKITYTLTDESPLLATYSLLPLVKAILNTFDIDIESADISLSARILSAFNQARDDLKYLSNLTQKESANIIKTPNISASLPQLKAAISELKNCGFDIPDYIDNPQNDDQKDIQEKYKKILGSAVNPALRDGNSIRRAPLAVKKYAKANPYKITPISPDSKTRVSSMSEGDFYANERAILIQNDSTVKILFESEFCDCGCEKEKKSQKVLKEFQIGSGDVLDASFLSAQKLGDFYKEQVKICKDENILFSLHLKATMMKVSDPVLFGIGVRAFFEELFCEFADEFKRLEIDPNNGISELLQKIENSPLKDKITQKYENILHSTPLNYVSENRSNLHVPSDVIVDASMPAMLKNGAKLWNSKNAPQDANAIIPDRTYAGIYSAVLDDLKKNGALDPAQIGSVSNVGLMAKKAQEYGSHDKTFIAQSDATFKILINDEVKITHHLQKGDIYRVNIAKNEAIENWIQLGLSECKTRGIDGIFWLDSARESDAILINKVKNHDANATILSPKEACTKSLQIIRSKGDVISITGNVLRDYLTDLFPILELGTSSKMLSIVPMLNGGAMFETGAGGSAPKQVTQLLEENHLRWDSLGEFLALQASIDFYAQKSSKDSKNSKNEAKILAEALDLAILEWLNQDRAPKREAKKPDNRTSHFYFIMYLCQFLAKSDSKNAQKFAKIHSALAQNETKILQEFIDKEGSSVDIGGYYRPNSKKVEKIMRSSDTFNSIIADL